MTTNPDEIRAEIERTRANLSNDVDALTEQANPKNIARRQVDKVKDRGVGIKDRIMGSAADVQDAVSDKLHDATSSVQGAVAGVSDKVHHAGDVVGDKVHQTGDAVSDKGAPHGRPGVLDGWQPVRRSVQCPAERPSARSG